MIAIRQPPRNQKSLAPTIMLSTITALSVAFSLPNLFGGRSATASMHHAGPIHSVYEQLYCETEYNPQTREAEEVCTVPPYAATTDDMGSCELRAHDESLEPMPMDRAAHCSLVLCLIAVGNYPAPGAGTRWACTEKMGANAEEELVNGELRWVHYVK